MAASILNGQLNTIYNCPRLRDVWIMNRILKILGCNINMSGNTLTVDSSDIKISELPENLIREMRSSIILMGALLATTGKAILSFPGGCEIGPRPIDLHLMGLRSLGAKIEESHGYIYCETNGLIGADISLDFPSVGATENIMLAAVKANGTTYIRNAAREPEIIDLQSFLNVMGCDVSGAGTNVIRIEGVKHMKSAEHRVIPDRIVAGTYLVAGLITGGNVIVKGVIPEHISSITAKLRETGCKIHISRDSVEIIAQGRPKAIESIRTLPYPGFPTDMQAQFMALLSTAKGISIITETIFENRFKHAEELAKMGAKIKIDGRLAIINGVEKLTGAKLVTRDLRGGAALVTAGLAAEGETIVKDVVHIDRGYDRIEEKLKLLGACIERIEG